MSSESPDMTPPAVAATPPTTVTPLPSDGDACGWDPSRAGQDSLDALPRLQRLPWRHEPAADQPSASTAQVTAADQPSASTATTPRTLADLTTTGIGGPIRTFLPVTTEAEFIDAIRTADAAGTPLLVIGGGSNILAGDATFDGIVIQDQRATINRVDDSACGGATVEATAGTPWDEIVATSIEQGWMGLEALSGIPGTVGAAPVQNIGAYGQEVAETISMVTVYDRERQRRRMLAVGDLKFGYRTSLLKQTLTSGAFGPTPRFVVLSVQFQFRHATLSAPIRYAELARTLGVTPGARVDARTVREAVIALRRTKGMVLDPADRDTYSTGSFFMNPVISLSEGVQLPDGAPRFEVRDHTAITNIGQPAPVVPGVVKTSAAWLIDQAGFGRGFHLPSAGPVRAATSSKHALALTNRGGARASDVLSLARAIRAGVAERFGIMLEPEPVTIGFKL